MHGQPGIIVFRHGTDTRSSVNVYTQGFVTFVVTEQGAVFLVLFAVVGVSLPLAYAEMCRDATVSRIANTNPGELGWEFWAKMLALGAGPLFGLLITLFPSMTDFIVSFLEPRAQAIK